MSVLHIIGLILIGLLVSLAAVMVVAVKLGKEIPPGWPEDE
jgi:hypothetical protein